MLNLPLIGVEKKMSTLVHFAITGFISGSAFLGVWYFSSLKEMYMKEELESLKWLKGKEHQTPRGNVGAQPVKLGPHSFQTLILSSGVTIIILSIIWLIKMAPFDRMFKITPLYRLFKMFSGEQYEEELNEEFNDDVNGYHRAELPASTPSSKEQIYATCLDLQRRMERLELSIKPLADSLDLLSDIVDSSIGSQKNGKLIETANSFKHASGDANAMTASAEVTPDKEGNDHDRDALYLDTSSKHEIPGTLKRGSLSGESQN